MMRVRKWGDGTDVQFGHGQADYWENVPDGVAQTVVSRLRLLANEWFLDLTEGTPYVGGVFGKHTKETYDNVIRARILGTQGVTGIASYESYYEPDTRTVSITVKIDTEYGEASILEVL